MLNNNSINVPRGAKIIDIQDRYNYQTNHYPGAVNIPYDELMNNYKVYLNKYDTYYIYCKSGKLSKRVTMVLSYLGYKVFMLDN